MTATLTAHKAGRVKAEGSNLVIPARLDELDEDIEVKVPASQAERLVTSMIDEFAKLRFLKRRKRH